MEMKRWVVGITQLAERQLTAISDQRVQVAVGIRKEGDKKDVYELATKMARLGLLNSEKNPS